MLTCLHQIIHIFADSIKYNLINMIKFFTGCNFIGGFINVPFLKVPNTGQYVQSKSGWYQGCLVFKTLGCHGLSSISVQ